MVLVKVHWTRRVQSTDAPKERTQLTGEPHHLPSGKKTRFLPFFVSLGLSKNKKSEMNRKKGFLNLVHLLSVLQSYLWLANHPSNCGVRLWLMQGEIPLYIVAVFLL
jgi:hypothetical protein